MYIDYRKDIVSFYKEGQKKASLPKRLIFPTTAGLKSECELMLAKQITRDDFRTLAEFLKAGRGSDQAVVFKALRNCDPDRFKPLVKFLKGEAQNTAHVNIELIACLIDFPNRPYKDTYVSSTEKIKEEIVDDKKITPKEPSNHNEENKVDPVVAGEININDQKQPWNKKSFLSNLTRRQALFAIITILLPVIIGFYYVMDKNTSNEQCMMWMGDHYEQTSCETKQDTLVIPLDIKRMNNLRKITHEEAKTLSAKQKLWYIRRNGDIEYYTASGTHPIDPERQLNRLTPYMIRTHLK